MNIAWLTVQFCGFQGDGKYESSVLSSRPCPARHSQSKVSKVLRAVFGRGALLQSRDAGEHLSLPHNGTGPGSGSCFVDAWLCRRRQPGRQEFPRLCESFNGAPLQCFVGENALQFISGGGALTYPGRTQLPAANCQSVLGPNGTITIHVPISQVNEPGAIDNRLHEVTASTMTLQEPANTVPDTLGLDSGAFQSNRRGAGLSFRPTLSSCFTQNAWSLGPFDTICRSQAMLD